MKSKKLNLNELKVKSFVTDFENGKENTVRGGLTKMGNTEWNCGDSLHNCGGGSAGCNYTQDCREQTAQNDMTCGLGCFPTDASCGIPCGPAGRNSDYC